MPPRKNRAAAAAAAARKEKENGSSNNGTLLPVDQFLASEKEVLVERLLARYEREWQTAQSVPSLPSSPSSPSSPISSPSPNARRGRGRPINVRDSSASPSPPPPSPLSSAEGINAPLGGDPRELWDAPQPMLSSLQWTPPPLSSACRQAPSDIHARCIAALPTRFTSTYQSSTNGQGSPASPFDRIAEHDDGWKRFPPLEVFSTTEEPDVFRPLAVWPQFPEQSLRALLLEEVDAAVGDLARFEGQRGALDKLFGDWQAQYMSAQNRGRGAVQPPSLADAKSVALAGPPGVGKSSLARCLGRFLWLLGVLRCGHHTFAPDAGQIITGFSDQSPRAMNRCFGLACDGVLFLDEVYKMGDGGREGQAALNELTHQLGKDQRDQYNVTVVAGYRDALEEKFFGTNEGLRSRFTMVDLPALSLDGLRQAFRHQLKSSSGGGGGHRGNTEGYSLPETGPVAVEWDRRMKKAMKQADFGNARFTGNLAGFARGALHRRLATTTAASGDGDDGASEVSSSLLSLTKQDVSNAFNAMADAHPSPVSRRTTTSPQSPSSPATPSSSLPSSSSPATPSTPTTPPVPDSPQARTVGWRIVLASSDPVHLFPFAAPVPPDSMNIRCHQYRRTRDNGDDDSTPFFCLKDLARVVCQALDEQARPELKACAKKLSQLCEQAAWSSLTFVFLRSQMTPPTPSVAKNAPSARFLKQSDAAQLVAFCMKFYASKAVNN